MFIKNQEICLALVLKLIPKLQAILLPNKAILPILGSFVFWLLTVRMAMLGCELKARPVSTRLQAINMLNKSREVLQP